ncbi:hypothetical protein [Oleomonas cavernae]|uniref:hypothetical protein n=1 Tax=Oleomonas cavernae TaxID=2320859 RepID=UPI001F3E185A|nr:hypothetical protein [Oleomonas cavernae]
MTELPQDVPPDATTGQAGEGSTREGRTSRLMAVLTSGPLPRLALALLAFSLSTAVVFVIVLGFGSNVGLVDRELGLRGFMASGLLLLPPVLLPRVGAGLAIRGRGQPLVTWSMAVALLAAVIAAAGLTAREGAAAWVALALDGLVLAVLAPLVLSAVHRRLDAGARLQGVATLLIATFAGSAIGIGAAHLLRALPGGEVLLALVLVVVTGFGWWLTRKLAAATVGGLPRPRNRGRPRSIAAACPASSPRCGPPRHLGPPPWVSPGSVPAPSCSSPICPPWRARSWGAMPWSSSPTWGASAWAWCWDRCWRCG